MILFIIVVVVLISIDCIHDFKGNDNDSDRPVGVGNGE
jgi:hypothetical protein